jgi:hypothetical protein
MSELHADASNPTGDADAATEVAEPIEEAAASSFTPAASSAATVAVAARHSTRKSTAAATTPSSAAAAIADAPKSTERPKRAKAAKALQVVARQSEYLQ